jgi:ADP-ribosyltransferase exoenzyme
VSVYAPLVADALAGSIDADKLAEAWQALHPKDVTKAAPPPPADNAAVTDTGATGAAGAGGVSAAATAAAALATGPLAAFMKRARAAITNALRPVMARMATEGWVLGQQSAKAVAAPPGEPPAGLPPTAAAGGDRGVEAVLHDVDWGSWTPGDYAAAEQIAGPGLRQLLDEQNIRIKSIADSRLEELSKVLEDALRSDEVHRPLTGPLPPVLSVQDLAGRLKGVLDNPDRAELVAQAEIARAQAAAARQLYAETGRTMEDISTAEDDHVCAVCDALEKANPHPLGSVVIPVHPRCRCVPLPVLDFGEPRPEPAPQPEPESAPQPEPEPQVEAEPLPEPEPVPVPEVAPEPEPELPPVAETPHIETGPAAGFSAEEFDDDIDAREWLRDHQPSLTDAQKEALNWYTGSGSSVTNWRLRRGEGLPDDIAANVRQLDSAMAPLPADLVLTRMVGQGVFDDRDPTAFATDLSDLVGSLISDKGYLSTSLGGPSAGAESRGVLMHIAAPEGTPAIVAGNLSANPDEREILLARGTRLAVSRMERAKSGYGWEAWLTVVPDAASKAAATVAEVSRSAEVVFEVVGKAPKWAVTAWDAK